MTTRLDRIDLQVQVLMFNKTIDTLGKDALQIALAGAAPCICCHHAGDGGIGAQQGAELGSGFKLSR